MKNIIKPEALLSILDGLDLTKPNFKHTFQIGDEIEATVVTSENSDKVDLLLHRHVFRLFSPDASAQFTIYKVKGEQKFKTSYYSSFSRMSSGGGAASEAQLGMLQIGITLERTIEDLLLAFMNHMLGIKDSLFIEYTRVRETLS